MVNTILVPVAVAIVSVLVGGCAGYFDPTNYLYDQ